jgi:acyl-coenzyme A synthetase/AMP-(fatty) acid ligase
MYLRDTHRSVAQRARLGLRRALGAGNFFWQAYDIAHDRDRPILFHPKTASTTRVSDEVQEHSLNTMRDRIVRYAAWYRDHGVGPSTRVGLYTKDGLLGLLHHIAVTGLGAATVHANPKMAPADAADYFHRTEIAALVGDAELLDACTRAEGAERIGAMVTVADQTRLDEEVPPPKQPMADFPYRHDADDLVMICHSSGTTGRPKATTFTHNAFFVGKRERLWNFPSTRADRMLTALPHSHSAGISYLSLAILLGLPTLLIDDSSGPAVAQGMNQFNPTVVLGFPGALAELPISELSPQAVGAVHTWMGMGDASHERHIRPLLRIGSRPGKGGRRGGSNYLDGLGSSEMGMVLFKHVHTPESAEYGRLIGKPVRVVRDAVVLDEQGRKLSLGQAGLLGVLTSSVTPGYWDDPDLTARSMSNGYFLTGDVVRRDRTGKWYHLDRTPDVINTSAGPVFSLPVEEVVLLASGALDAAVIAVDEPSVPGMSSPIAVVLFDDQAAPIDPAELLARCNAALDKKRLARLRAVVVAADRKELPIGVTGKVLKRELRTRHRTLLSDASRPEIALDDVLEAQ